MDLDDACIIISSYASERGGRSSSPPSIKSSNTTRALPSPGRAWPPLWLVLCVAGSAPPRVVVLARLLLSNRPPLINSRRPRPPLRLPPDRSTPRAASLRATTCAVVVSSSRGKKQRGCWEKGRRRAFVPAAACCGLRATRERWRAATNGESEVRYEHFFFY